MWSAKTKPGLQKPFTSLQTTVTNKNLHASSFYPPHPLHTKIPNNKKPRTTVLTQGEWWTSFTNTQTLITNRIGGTGKEKRVFCNNESSILILMKLTVEDSKLFNLSDSWLLLKLSLISIFVKKEHGKKVQWRKPASECWSSNSLQSWNTL